MRQPRECMTEISRFCDIRIPLIIYSYRAIVQRYQVDICVYSEGVKLFGPVAPEVSSVGGVSLVCLGGCIILNCTRHIVD